ncbi:DVU_1551 family NTP transferase [uncultured Cohaesibacter sp.]|uniref:DVU_1551 family NTP transferase n=1 Tax=uncultured Cohaesibacter sp. TaxID=1002546 RepID=UPI00292D3C06|nr:NTP transferase domain-containing protein [uncultured Cohaesibacter sp.]
MMDLAQIDTLERPALKNKHEAPIAAVILSAGLSSRMGAFKPLLPFGDGTVLSHVVQVARQAGAEPVHVVIGHKAEEIRSHVESLGAVAVYNRDYERGMFSSIKAGIASLPQTVPGCLLMPVDIPLVRPTTLKRVMAKARHADALLVHPVFDGLIGHPPFIARGLFEDLLVGDGQEGGAAAILSRHVSETIAVFDTGCLRDMDYPEEHAEQLAALQNHHLPDERECVALFDAAGAPQSVRRHGQAVAKLASLLAIELQEHKQDLDIGLITAGALLHDIAKGRPHHASVGAELLAEWGFPALYNIVGQHMALANGYRRLDEIALVYLADKLVSGEDIVGLEQRFAPAFERFSNQPDALAGVRKRLNDALAIVAAISALEVDVPGVSIEVRNMLEAAS